jgi:hypothetical protein
MEVRVLHTLPTCHRRETDYVRVHTCAAPDDDTVTLATIQRVVEKGTAQQTAGNSFRKRARTWVRSLIMRQPMTADEALDLATSYAERKKIPVVYADRE